MENDVRLGYLGFEVRDLPAWEAFAVEVLGLDAGERTEQSLTLRCDEWAARFFVTSGPSDDVSVLGWEVEGERALDQVVSRLRAAGVAVESASDEEARRRHVARLIRLRDPAGNPCEIFTGGERAPSPFRSRHVRSSFVTGAQGLGHVVVSASDTERSRRFYCDLLGFRLSDRIACEIYGHPVDLTFLHGSSRHHTVAMGGPQRKRIHHFLLEVASMDDVGLAYDRALRAGVRIVLTLGRHPNDRMFSFYARTPSGFEFEYGWGARTVDDATWQPTTYDHISEWGHHPPELLARELASRDHGEAMNARAVPEGHFAEIGDGLRVHYHEAGSGPAVLFLHGSGPGASGWSNFRGNYPYFAERGFRAIVPDTLGFGYSSKPESAEYTLDFVVGALERFLGALGVSRCAVVGNSHGGAMAIRLAHRRPELVERLVLMAPGGLEERDVYMKMEGIRAMVKALTDPGGLTRESLRRVFELQLFDRSLVTDELLEQRLQIGLLQPKGLMGRLQVPNLTPDLPRIACPIFGLWGVDDKFCPMSGAVTLARSCKSSRVLLLSECGHWVMVEKAALFNDACTRFLQEGA